MRLYRSSTADQISSSLAGQSEIVIRPVSHWVSLNLPELWHYRELLWILISREIKGRYRQMALGPLWIIIKPIVSMIIFSMVFGRLAGLPSEGIPYPIFTYTALLPWTYFAGAAGAAVGSLLDNKALINKVYFPRLIIPVTSVLSGLVDMAVSFIVLLGMMLYYRIIPSSDVIFLPFFILLAVATALTVAVWSASLTVHFRDIKFGATYMLNVWMYATPVAYSASLISDQWQWLYQLNPLYWVIEGFRWSLLGIGQPPTLYMLIPVIVVLCLLLSGLAVFQRTAVNIVDVL